MPRNKIRRDQPTSEHIGETTVVSQPKKLSDRVLKKYFKPLPHTQVVIYRVDDSASNPLYAR